MIFDDLNDRSAIVVDEYSTELDVPTYVYPSWLLPRLTARGDLSSSESIRVSPNQLLKLWVANLSQQDDSYEILFDSKAGLDTYIWDATKTPYGTIISGSYSNSGWLRIFTE